jgi:hypothetical protein
LLVAVNAVFACAPARLRESWEPLPTRQAVSSGRQHNRPGLLGPDNNFDFLEQLSYLRGKHSFTFGGEFRDAKINNASYANGRGRFRFTQGVAIPGAPSIASPTALEDFLAGVPGQVFFIAGSTVRKLGIN